MENSMTLTRIQFSFDRYKDDRVTIFHQGKPATRLKGKRAASFLNQICQSDLEQQQLAMAKITGNFKRSNERMSRRGNKP